MTVFFCGRQFCEAAGMAIVEWLTAEHLQRNRIPVFQVAEPALQAAVRPSQPTNDEKQFKTNILIPDPGDS
ncbi:MAG TPA: hypothetical protein VK141_09670 [Nitrosomonas sp.]|nr:hypothetical protein [Nitrosomonas sp.]